MDDIILDLFEGSHDAVVIVKVFLRRESMSGVRRSTPRYFWMAL